LVSFYPLHVSKKQKKGPKRIIQKESMSQQLIILNLMVDLMPYNFTLCSRNIPRIIHLISNLNTQILRISRILPRLQAAIPLIPQICKDNFTEFEAAYFERLPEYQSYVTEVRDALRSYEAYLETLVYEEALGNGQNEDGVNKEVGYAVLVITMMNKLRTEISKAKHALGKVEQAFLDGYGAKLQGGSKTRRLDKEEAVIRYSFLLYFVLVFNVLMFVSTNANISNS
jgi:hypothetical protein